MTFAVEPDDVSAYGTRLGTLAGQADTARGYLAVHLNPAGVATGIFAQVHSAMSGLITELAPNYTTLAQLSRDADTELGHAATFYRTTDHQSAATLDATY